MAENTVIWDETKALTLTGGDIGFLGEITSLFLQRLPLLVSDLITAIAERDLKAIQMAAHTLKSSAANFSASATVGAASAIELMSRQQDLSNIDEAWINLTENIVQLEYALQTWQHEAVKKH
jgi:HPt (histidine-containing phosphotransfer) domain-containing protein